MSRRKMSENVVKCRKMSLSTVRGGASKNRDRIDSTAIKIRSKVNNSLVLWIEIISAIRIFKSSVVL